MKKNTDVAVAILQTDLTWIKNKLSSIEDTMNKINMCATGHDNRIQSLEDWKKACNDQWNKSMVKWGIIISAVALISSIILKFI